MEHKWSFMVYNDWILVKFSKRYFIKIFTFYGYDADNHNIVGEKEI
jgi:hypothetical protein